uniref:Putative hemolymph juvenile hormone binding protein tabanus bromius n=1 Tax=Lutzomyia longipalpis TaxID=7200 RepID=A0A1B0CU12_LUTLO
MLKELEKNINEFLFLTSKLVSLSSDVDTLQFQLTMEIPKIKVRAQYRSSGVLILVQASGAGDYWGQYEGVKAKVYFKAVPQETIDDLTYLAVEQVKMDFSVKEINMGVENIANGNSIIQAALNLFINSNSQELLKEMKPALKAKLTTVLHNFMDKLFERIPLEYWIV